MKARSKKRRAKGPITTFKGRKYRGNQHSKQSNTTDNNDSEDISFDVCVPEEVPASSSSASERKFGSCNLEKRDKGVVNDLPPHYILINSEILNELFKLVGCCPTCNEKDIIFQNDIQKKKGIANYLSLKCGKCQWTHSTYSSNTIDNSSTPGRNKFDINVRAMIAFREAGKGLSAIQRVCGYMNMVPPMQPTAFYNIQNEVAGHYKAVAEYSMKRAADDLRATSADVAVSCDGAWQKRGFSSLNGFVSLVSVESGKCLDFRIKTKKCVACDSWKNRKDTNESTCQSKWVDRVQEVEKVVTKILEENY